MIPDDPLGKDGPHLDVFLNKDKYVLCVHALGVGLAVTYQNLLSLHHNNVTHLAAYTPDTLRLAQ